VEIQNICVLGAGLMDNGIAQVCAQADYEVTMRDIEQKFIDSGMNTIKKTLPATRKKVFCLLGRLPALFTINQPWPILSKELFRKPNCSSKNLMLNFLKQ
jgi:hypothetical protein